MTKARLAMAVVMTTLLSAAPPTAASATGVDVTVRAGGEPCHLELGCLAGITLTPLGSDVPSLEGTIDPTADPSSPGGSLTANLAPGTYIASVTALGATEQAPEGAPAETASSVLGGCARTIELAAERPQVELTASMAWDQPACGIVIEPAGPAAPRPEVATQIVEPKPTPRFTPRGAPTVSTTKDGVKLELWVKDETVRPGQWLLGHLRISNVGGRVIRHNGRFEDLDCPPISTRADASDLFDPGLTWTGVAATYKKRFFRDGLLTTFGFGIPRYARSNGCGDVGQAGRLRPGDVEDIPLAGMPRYWLRDQPLPPGTIHLTVGFDGNRPADRVSVSTDVELAGDPVDYPSPGQLVDAALSTPGFIETLERLPDPKDWANAHVSSWMKRPYPPQPRLDGARGAPDGIIEITQFFAGSERGAPFVAEAIIDPWTAESYGANAWPGWVTPGSGTVAATTASPHSSPSASADATAFATDMQPLSTDELLAAWSALAPARPPVTLVAEASLDLHPGWRGPSCLPEAGLAPCPWAALVTDPPTLPEIYAEQAVQELYQRAPGTVDGALAFELRGRRLWFLGRVALPADGSLVQPVSADTMAWADQTNAGELLAVDGWLTVLGWGVPCPAPPHELVGDTQADDSPFARCPAGWVSADPSLPKQAPGQVVMTPPGFAIPVQASAYEDFAPDPSAVEDLMLPPRRAVYLLRHVAIPGGRPTGWQVVGRLDPVSG